MLSHYWSNKTGFRVVENVAKSGRITQMDVATAFHGMEEVVGSNPTRSTIFANLPRR